tara:strand:+ start:24 stop:410 length:387 start_codon:yes stop_codon:yes gene_type:complete
MKNLNKVRIQGKIIKSPGMWESGQLMKAEFPKHVWVKKEKDEYKGPVHIIYTYVNPQFDDPDPREADYWMEYEGVFDTKEGLIHQLRHMNAKSWFTNRMTIETMDTVNKLHEKLTGKQHWSWAYGKDE